MIHVITYYSMYPSVTLSRFGETPRVVNPWEAIKDALEYTDDVFIFVVASNQLGDRVNPGLARDLFNYKLEEYLIVDHRTTGNVVRGITNRNYPDDLRRLKLFVLKGKGEKQNA